MNSVNIIGIVRDNIDDIYRDFEYELPYSDDPFKKTPKIAIRQWTNQPNARLNVIPNGTHIAAHGHLDSHEKFGTILIVENFQTIR